MYKCVYHFYCIWRSTYLYWVLYSFLHFLIFLSIYQTTERNQIEDPRLAWRQVQEAMLIEYLSSARNDLSAKQDIMQVKAQRLALAQDEYQHLNTTLTNLFSSRSSCMCFVLFVGLSLLGGKGTEINNSRGIQVSVGVFTWERNSCEWMEDVLIANIISTSPV